MFIDVDDEEEIIDAYLNGTPACECGELMQPVGDTDTVKCPLCGGTWDLLEYATIGPFSEVLSFLVEDLQPNGCAGCECSAYPKCKTSCPVYDD